VSAGAYVDCGLAGGSNPRGNLVTNWTCPVAVETEDIDVFEVVALSHPVVP
jgi:hypothetical protein